jgi:nicotinamide riboside transporter PnuC
MDIVLNMLKLLTRWKPDWLYEVIPYIYMVAGLATIFYFDSTAGYVSGTLFLVAVFFIWIKRKENRSFKKV